jgi:hypothetical protein
VLDQLNLPVIVAVIAVRVVKVAVHQVIDVVAVRHRFMAAAGAVPMSLVVLAAIMVGSALGGISAADRQRVFLDFVAFVVVQVPIVQVVGVALVADGLVAAVGPVLMVVAFVVGRHVSHLPPE